MEQNFDCVPCGFTSTNRYNYDIHIRTVKHKAKIEGLHCTQCGAIYNSRNKLTRHVKNVHVKKDKRISGYLESIKTEDQKPEQSDARDTNVSASSTSSTSTPIKINIRPKLQPLVKPVITITPKAHSSGTTVT